MCSASRSSMYRGHTCTGRTVLALSWVPVRPQGLYHGGRQRPIRAVKDQGGRARPENPDFDELVLDDEYYREMGLDKEDLEEQRLWAATDVDPEGRNLDLENLASISDEVPEEWRQFLQEENNYGPRAVLLAGFRAEEYVMVRIMLDTIKGHDVKVIPVTERMLHEPLGSAILTEEVDWSQPRPEHWMMGGAWGSKRTVLFSGLSLQAQATLVELLEESGLPPLCVTMAVESDEHKQLGEVLAEAVQAQKSRKNPKRQFWEEIPERLVDPKKGLEPIENLLRDQAIQQLARIEQEEQQEQQEQVPSSASPARPIITPQKIETSSGPGEVDVLSGVDRVLTTLEQAATDEEVRQWFEDPPGGPEDAGPTYEVTWRDVEAAKSRQAGEVTPETPRSGDFIRAGQAGMEMAGQSSSSGTDVSAGRQRKGLMEAWPLGASRGPQDGGAQSAELSLGTQDTLMEEDRAATNNNPTTFGPQLPSQGPGQMEAPAATTRAGRREAPAVSDVSEEKVNEEYATTLELVQEAIRRGISPETLKRMIDDAFVNTMGGSGLQGQGSGQTLTHSHDVGQGSTDGGLSPANSWSSNGTGDVLGSSVTAQPEAGVSDGRAVPLSSNPLFSPAAITYQEPEESAPGNTSPGDAGTTGSATPRSSSRISGRASVRSPPSMAAVRKINEQKRPLGKWAREQEARQGLAAGAAKPPGFMATSANNRQPAEDLGKTKGGNHATTSTTRGTATSIARPAASLSTPLVGGGEIEGRVATSPRAPTSHAMDRVGGKREAPEPKSGASTGAVESEVTTSVASSAPSGRLSSPLPSSSSAPPPIPSTSAATSATEALSSGKTKNARKPEARVFGPAPPPVAPPSGPLLNVRPEIQRALKDRALKVVDLSKVPSRYRDQVAARFNISPSQQPGGGQQATQGTGPSEPKGPSAADREPETLGPGIITGTGGLAREGDGSGRQTEFSSLLGYPGEEEFDRDTENFGPGLLGPEELMALQEGAVAEGLDVRRVVGEALNLGWKVDSEAAAKLGLELPTDEELYKIAKEMMVAAAAASALEAEEGEEGTPMSNERSGSRVPSFSASQATIDVIPQPVVLESSPGEGLEGALGGPSIRKVAGFAEVAAAARQRAAPIRQPSAGVTPMTQEQLKVLADSKGLDLEELLRDAREKGVLLPDK